MNTCRDSTDESRAATPEEWAAITFEPWSADGVSRLPTNDVWNQHGRDYLPTVRLGAVVLTHSKEDLIAIFRQEPRLMLNLQDSCKDLVSYFEAYAQILEGAASRILIAATVVAIEEKL